MFEIEFTDSKGFTHRKIVPNHRIARELAKSVAVAAGRRAIVRKRNTRWNILLIDLDNRSIVHVGKGYDTDRAMRFWCRWNHEEKRAIAVAWPETVTFPS